MRLNDFDSLVNEKRVGPARYDKCYCVAIAAGVATAASAAYGAYTTYESSKAQKAAVSQGGPDIYGKKIQVPDYKSNVQLPAFDSQSGATDYKKMLPTLLAVSTAGTQAGIKNREMVMPGSANLMARGSSVLTDLSHGTVPRDVIERTNRAIAEKQGGAVQTGVAGGGGQATTDFARSIGQTSQQQVDRFLSAAPAWEQLADQFAYTPQEAFGDAMNLLQTRYNYTLGAADVQNKIDENTYVAAANKARGMAMPDPGAVGRKNDALAGIALDRQTQGSYLTSINGIVSGLSSAYSAYGATQSPVAGVSKTAYSNSMRSTPYVPAGAI